MAALRSDCGVACRSDSKSCWHHDCKIVKRFTSGKFMIENKHGFIRAAVPADLYFTTDEEKLYRDYNLEADELELEAMNERLMLQARIKNTKFI